MGADLMTDLPPVNSAPFLNLPPGTVRLVAPPKVRKRRGVYEDDVDIRGPAGRATPVGRAAAPRDASPSPEHAPVKPTIPEVLDRFRAYHAENPVWGSLHVCLEDGNYDAVEFCLAWAREHGDAEGEALARILLTLSRTQRRKLSRIA